MSIWALIVIGAVILLIGFIILQRRRPQDADKVAAALDAAAKAAEQKAKDAAAKITGN